MERLEDLSPANNRLAVLRKLSSLLVGARVVHVPTFEAPLRAPKVDVEAFNRLREIQPDTDPAAVLADLEKVTNLTESA